MNWKQYSEIQRLLGYIEGLAMCVNAEFSGDLVDAVGNLAVMIDEIPINELRPAGGVCREQQETGNRF